MSFWQKHGAPTMHNMVGGILQAAVLGILALLFGLVAPARGWLKTGTVPAWLFVGVLVVLCSAFPWCVLSFIRKLRQSEQKLAEATTKLADANAKLAQGQKKQNEMAARLVDALPNPFATSVTQDDLDPAEITILKTLIGQKLKKERIAQI